jgi:hypothetical protein
MSYYTPNMTKSSAGVETRLPAVKIQLDPSTSTVATEIPPILRLHGEHGKSNALKISVAPSVAPARLSVYPCDARETLAPSVSCAQVQQDNLIRQIPRLRESLSALDEEIHSDASVPDHADMMRVHAKILTLQDKRISEVEDRLNVNEKKLDVYDQLHLATGNNIIEMRKATDSMQRSTAANIENLARAGAISRDVMQKYQNKIGSMEQDLRGVARQVEGVAGAQGAVRKLQGDAGRTRTVESEAVAPAAVGDNGELLRQVVESVVDMKKMLCKTSTDFASLSRKVDNIETQMNTSQSHAETLKMLQRDMFSSTKPKKTRS